MILGLWGQTTGTLSGTVKNEAGAAVPNAAITVTPVNGGAPQHTLADQNGRFTVTALPSAIYTVDVESTGYKRLSTQNIDLTNSSAADIQVQLQRGTPRETVQVQASPVVIHTENAEQSTSWEVRTITETPVYDRNHQELVDLTTGVTPPSTNPNPLLDPQQNRYWQTNGQPSGANRRTLDGVENDEPFNGTGIYVTPEEGVQQMHIMTSNYDAQYGRAAGTVLNNVTRTGTNAIHGSVFEFNSISAMAARNFFDPSGYPQAKFTINQTGASLGGPIVKDHTFFFADFEADLNRTEVPTLSTVPTAAELAGNFNAVPGLTLYNPATGLSNGMNRTPFPNNIIPANRLSPVAQSLAPYFPTPNASGLENNLEVNVPFSNYGYRGDVRLDHKMHDSLNLYARVSYSDYSTTQGSALGVLGGSDGHLQNANTMLGMTNALSPSLIMDLRLNYNRYGDKLNNTTPLSASALGISDPSAALYAGSGFAGLGIPSIDIGGLPAFGSYASYPQYDTENNWNLVNSWNWIVGRHNIHFGADLFWIRPNGFQNFANGPYGSYVFGPGTTASPTGAGLGPYGSFANSFAGFLLGDPTQVGRNLPAYTPGYSSWQASGYIADTIKITDRLTVDLGARYDVFTPLQPNRANGEFIYDPTANQLMPLSQNGVDSVGNKQINWNNIAPRASDSPSVPWKKP